ncbi:hypothetical protein QO010_002403 [Caulobacter ginsengisoli]|uniref:BioF2-like acetyltransferase domain-containing protein n=1 Tax=Caulobacter ginsengisoli TaxID=400775 RepID=A0ABU0IRI2_9CAUL|nr:GNAT family N-acetyltransferase [Caulobacter ginsengisoli]MDQ0464619.1 hypothetical protein [Caulobacter ginsengisoli]
MSHPYASRAYAEALSHIGRAVEVSEWRGFVLERSIAAGGTDAIGPYPLTVLPQDADVSGGLTRLAEHGLVSVVVVPDPLQGTDLSAFTIRRPFKTHQLIDGPFTPSKHHAERIRRGHRRCRVERRALADHLDDWRRLYAGLVERRTVSGAADFPDGYFAMLAAQPAMQAFVAEIGSQVVAMTLWFAWEGVVYNHLTASDAAGYANGASFALYDAAIQHFAGQGVMNLGGGAGHGDDPDDGLAAFKRGFANREVVAQVCGAALDEGRYAALSAGRETGFFPAYRG